MTDECTHCGACKDIPADELLSEAYVALCLAGLASMLYRSAMRSISACQECATEITDDLGDMVAKDLFVALSTMSVARVAISEAESNSLYVSGLQKLRERSPEAFDALMSVAIDSAITLIEAYESTEKPAPVPTYMSPGGEA